VEQPRQFFFAFIVGMLIPSLVGTGARVIMMDNLGSHLGHAVTALKEAGHYVVFRPVHSPIFGPVEWVFHYVEMFLKQHNAFVSPENFANYLRLAFLTVTPLDIKGCMSAAHFYVPGHTYHPWSGEI
jgi:transposase